MASLLLGLVCVALPACAPGRAKLTAINNAASLQVVIDQSLSDSKDAVHLLVREALSHQRQALAYQWQLEESKMILSTHIRFDQQFDKVQNDISARLNDAVRPIEKRLKDQIAGQQAIKSPEGTTAADSLRLQLASTLAVFQREGAKLELEAKQRLDQAKAKLLADIAQDFASPPDPVGKPVTDDDVNAILKDYDANTEKLRADVKNATESLRDYVALDEPWKYVLKGVVGQGPSAFLSSRIDQFAAKGREAISSKAKDLAMKISSKIEAEALRAATIPRP